MMSAYLIHSSDANYPVSHPLRTLGLVTFPQTFLAPRARGSVYAAIDFNKQRSRSKAWEQPSPPGGHLRARGRAPGASRTFHPGKVWSWKLPTRHPQDAPPHRPPSPARSGRVHPTPARTSHSYMLLQPPSAPCTDTTHAPAGSQRAPRSGMCRDL